MADYIDRLNLKAVELILNNAKSWGYSDRAVRHWENERKIILDKILLKQLWEFDRGNNG